MSRTPVHNVSRRERQILDILYRRGRSTAAEVLAEMPDPPGYSAVRAMLRTLEEKGHVRHEEMGPRYVYLPTLPLEAAKKSAARHMVETFFGGSLEQAVATLLNSGAKRLTRDELDRIATLIDRARKEGR